MNQLGKVYMESTERLIEGKRVIGVEADTLKRIQEALDETFVEILEEIINCKGKLIITGMGKPGHIAKKLAATFSSLGTSSFYLHPAEAMHGDLGMIDSNDVVIAISYSGESEEIVNILPNIKIIGAKLIAITGNSESTLAQMSDIVQVLPGFEEACHLGLAPTSSTTAVLAYGDALAVAASKEYGFKDEDFGRYHPAGSLGKKLLIHVDDLIDSSKNNPVVNSSQSVESAIVEMNKAGLGIVSVIDSGIICGVITDGDLRRALQEKIDIYQTSASEVMSSSPIVIESGSMAVDALNLMREKHISCLPILRDGKPVGAIQIQDVIKLGII